MDILESIGRTPLIFLKSLSHKICHLFYGTKLNETSKRSFFI